MFNSLKDGNFRLYFIGQAISMFGTWAQRVGVGWLAYRLTESVWMLGILGFAGGISMLLLAPYGGVLSDKYDRRKLMLLTQSLMMVQASALAVLAWLGKVEPWHLVALALFLGIVFAIDTPIRHSLIPRLVKNREQLPNAIALNSVLMNGARFVGPAVAAVVIQRYGEAFCFALNAATFVVIIYTLTRMRWDSEPARTSSTNIKRLLADGFSHARNHKPTRDALVFVAVVSFTVSQYPSIMPAIAARLYDGGPSQLGFLLSCAGIGAVCMAMVLARWSSVATLPRLSGVGAMVAGACMAALPTMKAIWFGGTLMYLLGAGLLAAIAGTNTWLQHNVHDAIRGRIMGLYSMAAFGAHPIGSMLSGAMGEWINLPFVLTLNGLVCVVAGAYYLVTHSDRAAVPAISNEAARSAE